MQHSNATTNATAKELARVALQKAQDRYDADPSEANFDERWLAAREYAKACKAHRMAK